MYYFWHRCYSEVGGAYSDARLTEKACFQPETALPEKVQSCDRIQIQSSRIGWVFSSQLLRPEELVWLSLLTGLTHWLQHEFSPSFQKRDVESQFCGLARVNASIWHYFQGTLASSCCPPYAALPGGSRVSHHHLSLLFCNVCKFGYWFGFVWFGFFQIWLFTQQKDFGWCRKWHQILFLPVIPDPTVLWKAVIPPPKIVQAAVSARWWRAIFQSQSHRRKLASLGNPPGPARGSGPCRRDQRPGPVLCTWHFWSTSFFF